MKLYDYKFTKIIPDTSMGLLCEIPWSDGSIWFEAPWTSLVITKSCQDDCSHVRQLYLTVATQRTDR